MANTVNDVEFWEDVNRRLDEIRVKVAVLSETYLAAGETGRAKDAHNIGGSILTLMSASNDNIRTLKARTERERAIKDPAFIKNTGDFNEWAKARERVPEGLTPMLEEEEK